MKIRLWGDVVGVPLQPEEEFESYLVKMLQVCVGVAHPAVMQVFPGVPELSRTLLLGVCWETQLVCLAIHSVVLAESLLMGWKNRSLPLRWHGDPRSAVWWER